MGGCVQDARAIVSAVSLSLLMTAFSTTVAQDTVAGASQQTELRTWTNRAGLHRTQAVFIESKGGTVIVEKKDGARIGNSPGKPQRC